MELVKGSPVILFESQKHWHDWLKEFHGQSDGVWLKLAKKSSGQISVTYAEALEEALCYGWIDSQKLSYDDKFFLQKFTPRGPRSVWSKVNVVKVEELIGSQKMQPAGLAAVEVAKKSGAWEAAYDSSSTAVIPEDFLVALDRNPKAKAFFQTLNRTNVYAICWRIQTAKKPETRMLRIEKLIEMLNHGEKLH